MRHLVVGTAGHIDHGKSALVEALTGVDPDRLEEEKRRGITIDLGFADLDLAPEGVVGFVDVPGHERFVRHMVAGSTGIDAAVLVIAADEGVKPQTREHLAILSLLGLTRGATVLSKIDLLDPELHELREAEVRAFVAGTFLADAPIVAVSARTGRGLDVLREVLRGLLASVPERVASGAPRLAIDRSFVMKGFGTIVTGTLTAGRLREGEEIEILPSRRRGRIRGLQVHRTRVAEADAGRRLAVNLQGLDVDEAPRGATLTTPGSLLPTQRARVRLEWLGDAPARLARGARVRVHHGTSEGNARLRRGLGAASPDEGFLEFEEPVVLVPGDRFVLRQPAPVDTVGGGIVVDAHPPRGRAGRSPGASNEAGHDPVYDRIARSGLAGRAAGAVAAELGSSREGVDREVQRLESAGRIVRAGGVWVDGAAWSSATTAVLAEVERFHRAEPLAAGLRRDALRTKAAAGMTTELFRELVDRLVADGSLRAQGDRIAASTFRVVLAEPDASRLEAIAGAFRDAGLDPPDAVPLALERGGDRGARLVELLVEQGRLVRLVDGRLVDAEALEALRGRVREFGRTSSTMDVAAFKRLAGVTRKNAIPLLEQLDAERVTRRIGNVREILSRDAVP